MTAFYGTRGADVFVGTAECDQFYVNNQADVIIGGGAGDVVSSSIDYVLDAGITSLIITGRAVSATGNDRENFVIGNRFDNIINGGRGIDRLTGGAGADTFVFDAGGRIDDQKLAERGTLDLGGQSLHPLPGEQFLRASIGESSNHASQ